MDILIVEDDDSARLALAGILASAGWNVHQAADGEHAWAMLKAGLRPIICCCDVQMPVLGGLELANRAVMHPVWKRLPFVMISAAADADTVRAASAAGIAGFVLKPFVATQALATLNNIARSRRRQQAEHYLVTSRRLGLDLCALEARIETLEEQTVASCASSPGAWDAKALAAECQELGLWAAASLTADIAQNASDDAADISRELVWLVRDQLACLRNLEAPA